MEFRKSKEAFGLTVLSFVVAFILIFAVSKGEPNVFDVTLTSWVEKVFGDGSVPFFETLTLMGSGKGIGIVGILFLIMLWWKKRDYAGMAAFAVAVALGNEVNQLLKNLVGRPRPVSVNSAEMHSLSFPSGHAMVGLILYMLIAYFLIKEVKVHSVRWLIGTLAVVLILLIGISRIVLVVHYPSDVLGGFAIGYIWTYLFIALYEVLGKKLNQRKS